MPALTRSDHIRAGVRQRNLFRRSRSVLHSDASRGIKSAPLLHEAFVWIDPNDFRASLGEASGQRSRAGPHINNGVSLPVESNTYQLIEEGFRETRPVFRVVLSRRSKVR